MSKQISEDLTVVAELLSDVHSELRTAMATADPVASIVLLDMISRVAQLATEARALLSAVTERDKEQS